MDNVWLATLLAFFVGLVAVPASGAYAAPSAATGNGALPAPGSVNGIEADALIDSLGSDLAVIDVRTPLEFNDGHLKNAILIPVQEIMKDVRKVPVDRPILFLCRSGGRAEFAYDLLHKEYPDNKKMWYLNGTTEYRPDGSHVFR